MSQDKKYNVRVSAADDTWTAEITRRVSARRTQVSKQQKGFASEAEAQAWGDTELKSFLEKQVKRNKAKSESTAKAKAIAAEKLAGYEAAKAERAARRAAQDDSIDDDDFDDDDYLD